MIALAEVARQLGLPVVKNITSGADAPVMAADGRVEELLLYAACDVATTAAVFRMLTGRTQPRGPNQPAPFGSVE